MSIHDRPYGVGLAYRYHLHEEVMHFASEIDLLELPSEDQIVRRRALSYPGASQKLAEVLENFSCVAHGISMSIGSVEPLDETYFRMTRRMLDEAGIKIFSEHLAYHQMDGTDIASFLGMPMSDVSLEWLILQYWHARELLGAPFALENVSLSFPVPDSQYSEPEFLTKFLERTDGSLLLDVTNLFNNCTNYDSDPYEFLHALPPDRVSQIHLAGGHYEDGFLIDSHSFPVMDEVWELYREAISYTEAEIVILERDYQCFPFREVMDDLQKAREIYYDIRPAQAPTKASGTSPVDPPQNSESPDPAEPAFADLRNFQRAIIKAIDDDDFRAQSVADANKVRSEFPMPDDWLKRFSECEKLDEMANSWKETQKLDHEDQVRFQQWEWSQWAMQSEPVAAPSMEPTTATMPAETQSGHQPVPLGNQSKSDEA